MIGSAHSHNRVCVVGAGIAGLVTAKVLAADGFEVTIVEKGSALGGTWNASRTYPGLRANNSKATYAFSDYPYPKDAATHPYAEQVRGYLESYANHFGIRERIRFNTEVRLIAKAGENDQRLAVTTRSADGEATAEFDFVAVCNGVFHVPNIPPIEGMDDFDGTIVPACDVTQETYDNCRHPVVVGGGKTAFDCAHWAAKLDLLPILVLRHPHWMAPRYLLGFIPGDYLIVSRLSGSLLRYHHLRGAEKFLHTIGKPIVRAWWGWFSFLFPKLLGMPAELTPPPLPAELERVGVGGEFFDELNAGRAQTRIGEIRRFKPASVELSSGEEIPADLVIFATGWRQGAGFIDKELRREIIDDSGRFHLYRHILPPSIPNMGFIGYASSFAAQMTAEVGAHWLSECFLKGLALPPVEEMHAEIDRVHAWTLEVMPSRREGYFVGAYMTNYINDLIGDMGLAINRTGNFLKEYGGPCLASRYATLTAERRQKRERGGGIAAPRFYFSAVHGLAVVALILAVYLW